MQVLTASTDCCPLLGRSLFPLAVSCDRVHTFPPTQVTRGDTAGGLCPRQLSTLTLCVPALRVETHTHSSATDLYTERQQDINKQDVSLTFHTSTAKEHTVRTHTQSFCHQLFFLTAVMSADVRDSFGRRRRRPAEPAD